MQVSLAKKKVRNKKKSGGGLTAVAHWKYFCIVFHFSSWFIIFSYITIALHYPGLFNNPNGYFATNGGRWKKIAEIFFFKVVGRWAYSNIVGGGGIVQVHKSYIHDAALCDPHQT